MQEWIKLALVVGSSGVLVSIMIIIIQNSCRNRKRFDLYQEQDPGMIGDKQFSHHVSIRRNDVSRTEFFVIRRGPPAAKPNFSWADHPSLLTAAVENGWSEFGFAAVCVGAAAGATVEIGWEVSQRSVDFMQKIQFRQSSGTSRKIKSVIPMVVKSNLPLPGPPLGISSFPQEAYFEITILPFDDQDLIVKSEGEKIKLIKSSKSLLHLQESIAHKNEPKRTDFVALSVGLAAASGGGGGGAPPLKLPGSYQGSIGFNSNASVFVDGVKLVCESEAEEWGRTEKVIGCGYNPSQKKVLFTVDSHLLHEIHCKSDEFGGPIYPIIAANADIMVLVNLGQCCFKYAPANLHRTPNPCFIGPLASNSPALGYEDSRELFSMGRIDSEWLNTAKNSNNNTVNSIKQLEYDVESEGDLFEIMLDHAGKSPITVTPSPCSDIK